MTNNLLRDIGQYFTPPKIPFGGWDAQRTTLEDARVVLFGVPFDGTATYGGGSEYGPWAIRETSAKQIETYSSVHNYDPYADVGIFDLGDFRFGRVYPHDRELIYTPPLTDRKVSKQQIAAAKKRVNRAVERLKHLEHITRRIREEGKVPLMLGGEHLVSLWTLRAVLNEEPVLLWFDAHLDCKEEYLEVAFSHTTPLYYLLAGNPCITGDSVFQIGIRQGSPDEYENAYSAGVNVYKAFSRDGFLFEGRRFERLKSDITKSTAGRNVAISFDIDVFDASLTPCTGTPSYGGMQRHHAAQLIDAISPDAQIIYLDFVETSSDGEDTREGTLATEMLVDHMLAHKSLRR